MFKTKMNQIIILFIVLMVGLSLYIATKDHGMVQPNLVQETDMNKERIAEEKDFFEGYDELQALPPDEDTQVSETINTGNKEEIVHVDASANAEGNADSVNATEAIAETPQRFEAIITKKDAIIVNAATNKKKNAVKADKNMDVSYFAEEKMLREQSRALQVEELTQYVANENLDKESKSKAAANLLAIQERMEKESNAEALLRTEGFKEVYIRIDDNSVDVVVNKDNLTDSDIAQIEEIVNRKTGYSVGKIKITPLRGIANDGANQ